MSRSLPLFGFVVALYLLVGGVIAEEKDPDAASPAKTEQVQPGEKKPDPKEPDHEKTAEEKPKEEAVAKDEAKEKPASVKKEEAAKADKPSQKAEGKKEKPKVAKKPAVKKTNAVCFTLRGEYPEGPTMPGLFGDFKRSLASVIKRLDAAAEDKDVAAVWLKIEGLAIGRGKIFELRQAIQRVRRAKKPVYAELTTASTGEYLVAAACDEIWMPECGILVIPGVRAEVMFFKGLLEKIGVEFDVVKMGKYKGAAEPLTRRKMSPPLRESFDAVVDDIYNNVVGTIAADRKMKDYKVKTLIDEGLFTAKTAHRVGLIDHVLYADQFEKTLKKKLKAKQIKIVTNYMRKKQDMNFSGLGGMVKMIQMMMGKQPGKAVSTKKKIAVVYAVGMILEGKSKSDLFGDPTMGSTTMVAALKKAAEDPKVVAVVMRIDSPGGSAVASDLIWRETVRMKKPLIVSMSDVAGSGGYYIAMGAKKIYAAPGTLTGSIGVIGGKLVTKRLFEKLGLHTEVISRGANSGSFSITQPFSPEERKVITALIRDIYRQFVGKAAKGRKMPYNKLEELAQGRIYSGQTAKKLGLIDEIGTLYDAIAAAKKAAGLKPDAKVDILVLPRPRSIFEQIFGDPAANTDLESLLPGAGKLIRQTRLLRKMFSQPVLMWMPYQVQIK